MVPTTYPTFEDTTGALSLMEQFELQVENEPGRLAAWYEESSISFGELNRRSNQLARYLRKRGVAADSLVGLCIPRSIEMLIAVFGIMKAGGGYLPLDPCYPAQRISYMIEDSQIRIALCRDTGSSLLLDIGCLDRVELVDLSNTQAMQESGENLAVALDPDDLAYVIYTAGSTGTPKGVMGTHRGMLNRLNWMWQKFPFEPDEVCCLNTSLNFLDSFWGIFGPLLQGIPIVLIPDATVRDPLRLLKQLEQFRTTRMVLVPSLLRVILDHYGDAGARLEHLRIWVSSGEALPGDLADRFRQILPHSRLLNLYGSSELSADCTWYEVTKHPDEPVAIGQPIANNRVYILDENLREVPAGELGGIYVSGECLARGYYRNPGFTAQRFVANPLGLPGDRIYRTGDIGRIREGGEIEYLGRADHQVKIRGFRVELGEIEAALKSRAEVADAAVIAREDSSGQKRLVAYVVAAKGSAVLSAPMRRYLGEKLPEYMVPAAVVSISSLPLNPSGKLDRGALPAPEFCSSDKEATNPQEQLLARLFAEVLELDKVGIDERFFDVGGDSLSAIRLVQRARKAGLVLNACDVVQHQSVQALAAIARSGSDHTTIDGDEGLCHHIPLKMTMEHSSGS